MGKKRNENSLVSNILFNRRLSFKQDILFKQFNQRITENEPKIKTSYSVKRLSGLRRYT